MENDRGLPLPRCRNGESSRPREMIGNRPVCEYLARLLNRELHNGEYSRVVRGDTRTRRRVSKRGIQPNVASYTASFRCASIMFSGIQSHTERRGSRDLCRTPIRSSRPQVRLHFEIIVCAMLGTHFPKVYSLEVHIVTMQLLVLIIVHCDGTGLGTRKSCFLLCVLLKKEQ